MKNAIDVALADLERLKECVPKNPGLSLLQMKKIVETYPCHKCSCTQGMVVQQLSVATGRGIQKIMVVCDNCWNVDVRDETIERAVVAQNNMNWALKR